MWMWQKKHNLDENFRYDETSHWKWCYVDVENDGYIYVKVAIAQDAITGGSWHIYNSDKELINVGAPYETYEKSFYQYKIRLYEIPVTKGRCYFKVTHDAAAFQGAKSCYTIAISSNKFVKDL